MDCQPQGNYVLIEVVPMELPGGIKVPGQNGNFAHLLVLAVGPGKLLDSGERAKPLVKEGDRVLIHEIANKSGRVQALATTLFDGRELLLVDAGDIIGTTSGEVMPLAPKIVKAQHVLVSH